MRKNVLWLLLVTVGLLFFVGCGDDDEGSAGSGVPYDPSKPVEFTSFMPDSGGIRTKFIVQGKNFGTDISKISVLFNGTRKATIVASDGRMIYCIAPKQPAGENSVGIIVDGSDTVYAEKKFSYSVSELVSTIAGQPGNGGTDDGTLATCKFNKVDGLAYVGDGVLIAFVHDAHNVRLVSINDNAVTTLHSGMAFSSPATKKDYSAVYVVSRDEHRLYRFSRANLWQPEKMGIIAGLEGEVWGCAFNGTEDYLYVTDVKGHLVRVKIEENKASTSDAELLTDKGEWANLGYICYNPHDDHFYVTSQTKAGVYRVSADGKTIEIYAGFNSAGHTDGYGLEAAFNNTAGICVDSEGDMYVCQPGVNDFWLRKISLKEGYVSTVAGTGKSGNVNGKPLESTFNYPYSCVCDEEDNVYIGERWGCCIRKYAVE